MTTSTAPLRGGLDLEVFDHPPAYPMALLAQWMDEADRAGVPDTTSCALATVNDAGQPSNRMIRVLSVTDETVVFSSHTGSRKGSDAAATHVGAGVLYWPAVGIQVSFAGALRVTPPSLSDRLWRERDPSTYPMSVATEQSAHLEDVAVLRSRAAELEPHAASLQRPDTWVGFELVPTSIEFWHSGTSRLHRRLRYDRRTNGWEHRELQP